MGLFGPAYKSKNEEKALKSLESIHDINTLLELSLDPAVLINVRTAAIHRIGDQEILFKIAATKEYITEIRKAAISAFTDETRIRYITGSILGSNLNGELDYLIKTAPDRKALAKEIWRQGLSVGIAHDYGFLPTRYTVLPFTAIPQLRFSKTAFFMPANWAAMT